MINKRSTSETEPSSHNSATASRWTRSAASSRTAASWQSLARTQFGMQDSLRIGVEVASWSLDWRATLSLSQWHNYPYLSPILMSWFVYLTSRDCCIAIVLRDLSLGTVWSLSLPLWIQSHNLAVYWKCIALYNKLVHSLTKIANEKYQQKRSRCFSAENLFKYFVNSVDSW